MDSSALRNVFGSSASLAELSGDTSPSRRPKSGYSRFGSNERPPSHQMHTKTRRTSSPPKPEDLKPKRRFQVWPSASLLATFGVAQALLIDYHTPFFLNRKCPSLQTVVSLVLFVAVSVAAGFTIPATDREPDEKPERQSHTSPKILQSAAFTSQLSSSDISNPEGRLTGSNHAQQSHQRQQPRRGSVSTSIKPQRSLSNLGDESRNSWFQSMARGYGILLGLVYLSEQSPDEAGQAWLLIVPGVWYVSDATSNGFVISAAAAVLGSVLSYYLLPGMQAIPGLQQAGHNVFPFGSETLYTLSGTATTFFATSIMAGNLGRGLR